MTAGCVFSSKRELEVIEYPGKVVNIDRMIATLGNITKISQAFCGEQKRLELRYHYENPYNKGTYGESNPNYGLLLSVKVKRYKKKTKPPEYNVRVLGHLSQVFSFKNLCDFQYLPLYKNPDINRVFNALDHLKPKSPIDTEYFSRTDAPFLCLPTSFARFDSVAPPTSIFRYDTGEDGQEQVLGTAPKVANEARDFVSFNLVDPLPQQPDLQILKRMKVKYVSDEQFQRVKKLFEDCPIWTRIALLYESGVSNDKMKCIVPSLAYYFTTGPWRMLYVRYGYDPRKDFESRYYQTFDFRLRFRTGVAEFVAVRKELLRKQHENKNEVKTGALAQDLNYPYFSEDRLPRARQCILRYCDLHVPKIQEMLEKIPSPMTGATCNEKTGWLPVGFDAQVRQLVCNSVKELLRMHNRKDSKSDDNEVEDGDQEDEVDDEEEMELHSDDDDAHGHHSRIESMDDTVEDMQI